VRRGVYRSDNLSVIDCDISHLSCYLGLGRKYFWCSDLSRREEQSAVDRHGDEHSAELMRIPAREGGLPR